MMNKIKTIFLLAVLLLMKPFTGHGQAQTATREIYEQAYKELESMLNGTKTANFKRAVFLTENAYFKNELDYSMFCKSIDEYENLCRQIISSNELLYDKADKEKMSVHAAIFTLMTDTLLIPVDGNKVFCHLPFTYDFEDISGEKEWSQMFVTKLMATHKGNCHSMPYLYKILAEELGQQAYLSLAPNHIYIKLQSKEFGWYNTELTSGMFPIDAWLMASGFVHLSSIQNGIYMDTLSTKQSIAVCMVDLAQAYEKLLGVDDGSFIIKACNKALEHFPNYINALLTIAETRFQLLNQDRGLSQEAFDREKTGLESLYSKIHNLGYRKMPEQMYLEWLVSLKEESNKYQNPKLKNYKKN